jgi:uncharacterized protein YndB with AHSA1/START domain
MKTLTCTLEIDAPAHEVWRVLTTNELIKEWAGALVDGLSIRTSWKEGDKVTWTAPGGTVRACGKLTTFQPERLLRFDYDSSPRAVQRNFSETFEIEPGDHRTRLSIIAGPLDQTSFNAMMGPARQAIEEIRSLAEESAQIHRAR